MCDNTTNMGVKQTFTIGGQQMQYFLSFVAMEKKPLKDIGIANLV